MSQNFLGPQQLGPNNAAMYVDEVPRPSSENDKRQHSIAPQAFGFPVAASLSPPRDRPGIKFSDLVASLGVNGTRLAGRWLNARNRTTARECLDQLTIEIARALCGVPPKGRKTHPLFGAYCCLVGDDVRDLAQLAAMQCLVVCFCEWECDRAQIVQEVAQEQLRDALVGEFQRLPCVLRACVPWLTPEVADFFHDLKLPSSLVFFRAQVALASKGFEGTCLNPSAEWMMNCDHMTIEGCIKILALQYLKIIQDAKAFESMPDLGARLAEQQNAARTLAIKEIVAYFASQIDDQNNTTYKFKKVVKMVTELREYVVPFMKKWPQTFDAFAPQTVEFFWDLG